MAPVLLFSAPISKNPESLALNSCAVEVPAAKTSRTARKPLLMSRDRSIVVLPFCDCSYPNRGRLLLWQLPEPHYSKPSIKETGLSRRSANHVSASAICGAVDGDAPLARRDEIGISRRGTARTRQRT